MCVKGHSSLARSAVSGAVWLQSCCLTGAGKPMPSGFCSWFLIYAWLVQGEYLCFDFGRLCSFVLAKGKQSFVGYGGGGSEGRLSLSKVSWSACVHMLPFGPAARMQSVLFLPG